MLQGFSLHRHRRLSLWLSLCLLVLLKFVDSRKHRQHAIVPKEFVKNITRMTDVDNATKLENQQLLDMYGHHFYVHKPQRGTHDIIKWIANGWSGEGKVQRVIHEHLQLTNRCSDTKWGKGRGGGGGGAPIVLDVGSNAGIYGLWTASLGCSTYMFDVQPICQQWLHDSIVANELQGIAHVIPFGASNETQLFEVDASSSCHGGFQLSPVADKNDLKQKEPNLYTSQVIRVGTVRIDALFAAAITSNKMPPIALVKIDTEGHEAKVIAGMQNLLSAKIVERLIIEMTPDIWIKRLKLTRSNVADIFTRHLWDNGYQNVTLFTNNWKCCDSMLTTREAFYQFIESGRFQDGMQDVHFALV